MAKNLLFKSYNRPTITIIDNAESMRTNNKKKNNVQRTKEVSQLDGPNKKVGNKFYLKCAKKREEKGLVILPRNIETKIYRLKKALQKKEISQEEIRTIIRRKRRQEELKLRKYQKHVCFRCRQPGHSVASCPSKSEDEPEDICYFCGSTEHILYKCAKYLAKLKHQASPTDQIELPFVTCFICQQKGHLTRNCSLNQRGAFPKGGKCRKCGSIKHTFKECSLFLSEEKQNSEITLPTIHPSEGIDLDDYFTLPNSLPNVSSNKVVTF